MIAETRPAFTPGPWTVCDPDSSEALTDSYHVNIGSGGRAVVFDNYGDVLPEQDEADARLIGAAPDQHAAMTDAEAVLSACLRNSDRCFPTEMGFTNALRIRDAARAALAKADGR